MIRTIMIVALCVLGLSGAGNATQSEREFAVMREKMVRTQIEARGVKDTNVLSAMLKVERHKFVPDPYKGSAYEDRPLPISEGQTISQPYVVALMTQALAVNRSSKVLEIGTGSGYQAAVLAELCDSVFTVEINKFLGESAGKLLSSLGYARVKVRIGDGYQGWKEHAPFDGIIVTCAATRVPKPLADQLKEGGIMVIPTGGATVQELQLFRKKSGALIRNAIVRVRFVPMTDESGKAY
ncbi:MAG TPA: protein-L-isoaspartate(D-aspartate) O-methyltransferase [Chitinivibrionales bacterium]|nr:protein-L-isoaspartate(D-aspartate) O-methyltransferase [Chitinivibrionales bacterium]